MANEATATQGMLDEAAERIRITTALDVFELWFQMESDPKFFNDMAALRTVARKLNLPVAALALEMGRMLEAATSFRASNIAEIEGNPLLKSILLERDGGDDDDQEA